MLDSFIIFLVFLAFLMFGYLSILRVLVRREFGAFSIVSFAASMKSKRVLSGLGSSAFFVSMPATSLLLFWGWGPALLWILIFHLLVESVFHLQYTTTEQDLSLAELLIGSNGPRLAIIESVLVQAFFILLMAITVTLLATLIDKQSGLLFALLALSPAQQLLRTQNQSVPFALNLICSIGVLIIGVALAHQLGFSVYGNWAPFETILPASLDWLSINNVTLIAGILIITSFLLAKKGQFQTDVATFAGATIGLLIIIMLVRLFILRPELDAPLNAVRTETNNLPLFVSFCFFSFAGISALLIRLLNDETNYNDTETSVFCFNRLQSESIVQMIFSMLVVIGLASALGIGAWKTHYLQWSSDAGLVNHLDLAIRSTLQYVNSSLKIGTFAHTAIMACMCIAGISFSMMCVSRFKITRHSKEGENSLYAVVMNAKIPQAIIIFILSCYLIEHGVSIRIWLISGMLSWALIVHLMLSITHDMNENEGSRLLYGGVSLALIGFGILQILTLSITWLLESEYVSSAIALGILLAVLILWWKKTLDVFRRFAKVGTPKQLDID